ncbi:hypothetical protein [Limnohabitans sp. Rim8]|uniref:hypothetical protein n=1 Tax=Limnohabitans sp. Rim8 TaxID=1100718 RepID=UPI0026135DFC|nr:hypothetical protein [Limnohabitans sp. Rim8]
MSHIFAFILGMSVATYGIGETIAQMEKVFRTVQVAMNTVQVAMKDKPPVNENH